MKNIEKEIISSKEEDYKNINWTKVWSKKYPILIRYKNEVNVEEYSIEIRKMIDKLKSDYNYSEVDSMLVLKDILACEYLDKK